MDVNQMPYIYKGTVCSDLEIIKTFIDEKLKLLGGIIQNRDILFDIRIILNELIVNGALHGNECMSSKCVTLSLEVVDNKLKIEVKDEGEGIDYDIKSYNPTELKCCGRGLVIVNGLSDEFYVDKNRVVAIKYFH
ncbi:ATP-binding protein [Tissierellaceae bacterium BX21]|jgi:serine/threonine-protein kinase RsbW|uniref:ATP-binding protein n=2 Tax=Paratissierella segnis TaxID=2763679 RepID=A0A926EU51_9FIRM|nr:ATP-binding protein [Paratissierella segnis]